MINTSDAFFESCKFIFYWVIIALPWCVSFRCESAVGIHISLSLFSDPPHPRPTCPTTQPPDPIPLLQIIRALSWAPCAIQWIPASKSKL